MLPRVRMSGRYGSRACSSELKTILMSELTLLLPSDICQTFGRGAAGLGIGAGGGLLVVGGGRAWIMLQRQDPAQVQMCIEKVRVKCDGALQVQLRIGDSAQQ